MAANAQLEAPLCAAEDSATTAAADLKVSKESRSSRPPSVAAGVRRTTRPMAERSGLFARLPSGALRSFATVSRKWPMSPVSSGGVRVADDGGRLSHPTTRRTRSPSPFWLAKTPQEDFSYRSFYSVRPTTNRYLERKEHQLVKALQKLRLQRVTATVDTGARRAESAASARRSAASRDGNNSPPGVVADSSPQLGISKADATAQRKKKFNKFKYSREFRRKARENEICFQNKRILERLMQREPMVSDRNLRKSWKKITEYQANIRKYPPGYWRPTAGDYASRKQSEDTSSKETVIESWTRSGQSVECTPINVWTHPQASPLSLLEKATVALEQLGQADELSPGKRASRK